MPFGPLKGITDTIKNVAKSPIGQIATAAMPGLGTVANFASLMGGGGKASDLAGTVAAGGGLQGAANSIVSVARDDEGIDASNTSHQANLLKRSAATNQLLDLGTQLNVVNRELQNGRTEIEEQSENTSTITQTIQAKAKSTLANALREAQRG